MIAQQAKNKIQEVKAKSLVLGLDKATQEEEKESQKQTKESEILLLSMLAVPQDHQTNNPNIYTEDLA